MSIISVPRPLRKKLGEDGSDALVYLLNQQSESVEGDVIKIAEEKFERRLSEEISKVNVTISRVQSNIIRWMFIFWIGQFGVMLGLFFLR